MLNKSGVKKTTLTAPKQILANVPLQHSVGCIVPADLGVAVGSGKLVKAGTPIHIDLMNLQTAVEKPAASKAMNAVLLHDVDVSDGNAANGTALIFGFVNVNRVDTDVAVLITEAQAIEGASALLTFLKA